MISADLTRIEVAGALAIAVISAAIVAVMAWTLLRPSRVPERLTVPEVNYDVKVVAGTARPREAFQWPRREPLEDVRGPVRENFRCWLEGGPDYCG